MNYLDIADEVFAGDGDSGEVNELWECRTCGAVVRRFSRDLHSAGCDSDYWLVKT